MRTSSVAVGPGRGRLQRRAAGTRVVQGPGLHRRGRRATSASSTASRSTPARCADRRPPRAPGHAARHRPGRDPLDRLHRATGAPPTSFLQSNVPEATDHSGAFAYDPDRAAKLLDDAGWAAGPGRVPHEGRQDASSSRCSPTRTSPPPRRSTSSSPSSSRTSASRSTSRRSTSSTYGERSRPAGRAGVRGHPQLHRRRHGRRRPDRARTRARTGSTSDRATRSSSSSSTAIARRHRPRAARNGPRRAAGLRARAGLLRPARRRSCSASTCSHPTLKGVSYNGVAYANFYTAWIAVTAAPRPDRKQRP